MAFHLLDTCANKLELHPNKHRPWELSNFTLQHASNPKPMANGRVDLGGTANLLSGSAGLPQASAQRFFDGSFRYLNCRYLPYTRPMQGLWISLRSIGFYKFWYITSIVGYWNSQKLCFLVYTPRQNPTRVLKPPSYKLVSRHHKSIQLVLGYIVC